MKRFLKSAVTCFLTLLFSQGIFASNATQADFNGDGKGDILYRATDDLTWRLDIMDGAQVTESFDMDVMSSCCGWLFNGSGDFNGDGNSDVIIRNTVSGRWYIYNIDNGAIPSRGYVDIEDATIIGVQAVADFNKDGMADVLLRNEETGEWTLTLLNNRTVIQELSVNMSTVTSWTVIDAQDYDGNGSPDILIRNSTSGSWYIYLYDGTDIISRGYITTVLPTDLNEEPQGVGDFDGDGKSDLLFRNLTDHTWSIAFMDGRTPTLLTDIDINNSSAWQFNAVNDFDNDGKADISLRTTSAEQIYMYFMNGSNIVSQADVSTSLPTNLAATTLVEATAPTLEAGDSAELIEDAAQTFFNENISDIIDTKCITCHVSGGVADTSGLIYNASSVANYQSLNRNILEDYVAANGADAVLQRSLGLLNHTGGAQLTEGSTDYNNLQTFLGYFDSSVSGGSSNTAPVANAGTDQTVVTGSTVNLDGSSSSDADGDSLSYLWSLTSTPTGSAASLTSATADNPSFTADLAGSYVASLTVNDGTTDSSADTVTVTAANTNLDITDIAFTNRSGDCANYEGTFFSNVTDLGRSVNFSGDVAITSTSSKCTFVANEIPNHDFNHNNSFATDASEQSGNYEVPRNPTAASSVTTLTLTLTNALMLNGVVLDLLAAACYDVGDEPLGQEKIGCGNDEIDNPWRYDPMSSLNSFGTDSNNAHTQPDGTYHYHGDPLAMYDTDCDSTAVASPVVGFAADGFPIYGPCFEDPDSSAVRRATSSYQLKSGTRQDVSGYTTPAAGNGSIASNNYDGQFRGDYEYQAGSGDLDECNGMTIDGQYGYYITNSFPWVLGCYKGTTDSTFDKQQGPGIQGKYSHSADGHTHH